MIFRATWKPNHRPTVVAPRRWWQHPVFPWGVYSLTQDRFPENVPLHADRYFAGPFQAPDGGGGVFIIDNDTQEADAGKVIVDAANRKWVKQ